jgi:hypothetical protein
VRRLVLSLPVVFLALSFDRVFPDRVFPPALAVVASFDEAAPSLPGFNEGLSGVPGQPLSVVLVGRASVIAAGLSQAGWHPVPGSFRDALLSGHRKVADYRLRGRLQDMNWVLPTADRGRHVLRLWRTGLVDPGWRAYWWGCVTYEGGEQPADRTLGRDLLAQALSRSARVRGLLILPAPRVPREGIDDLNRAYTTDGRVVAADLR